MTNQHSAAEEQTLEALIATGGNIMAAAARLEVSQADFAKRLHEPNLYKRVLKAGITVKPRPQRIAIERVVALVRFERAAMARWRIELASVPDDERMTQVLILQTLEIEDELTAIAELRSTA